MSYFLRNAFSHSTPERQTALQKSERQRVQRDFQPLDSLTTGVGPDRGPLMDARERQLAKMEAEEARQRAVHKAEEARDAARGKNYTLRDNPQNGAGVDNAPVPPANARRKAATAPDNRGNGSTVSAPDDDADDVHSVACAKLDAITKSMKALVAEHEATMRRINGQGADAEADKADPTADPVQGSKLRQPGTSNLVHDPHPESTLATRDQRTVHSVHNVNRQVRGVPVAKSEHVRIVKDVDPGRLVNAAGVDLATLFTGVRIA